MKFRGKCQIKFFIENVDRRAENANFLLSLPITAGLGTPFLAINLKPYVRYLSVTHETIGQLQRRIVSRDTVSTNQARLHIRKKTDPWLGIYGHVKLRVKRVQELV